MQSLHHYTTVLIPDDNGTFITHVPAIPGCHARGATPEEARQKLVSVFEMMQEEYREEGKPLPDNVHPLETSRWESNNHSNSWQH